MSQQTVFLNHFPTNTLVNLLHLLNLSGEKNVENPTQIKPDKIAVKKDSSEMAPVG